MDKMVPDPSPPLPPSIPEIQAQIDHLEASHRAKGFPLSGRIIHLCHHLPVEITKVLPPPQEDSDESEGEDNEPRVHHEKPAQHDKEAPQKPILRAAAQAFSSVTAAAAGVLSPPRTPEFKESEALTLSSAGQGDGHSKWKLQARRGHTAMISGMRSLSSTHEQVIVAWSGDIMQEYETPATPSHHRKPSQSKHAIPGRAPLPGAPSTCPTPRANSPANGAGAAQEVESIPPSSAVPVPSEPPQVYVPPLTTAEQKEIEQELKNFSNYEEAKEGRGKMTYVPVFVGAEDAKGHYEGYCKTTLWPLFHYLLWLDTPTDLPSPDPSYQHYENTNLLFAKRAAEIYRPGDLVVIHDYHLLLVPKMLREAIGHHGVFAVDKQDPTKEQFKALKEREEISIGMFVHTPWPSSEVFRCLPKRKEILDGMLGANHVAFQTYSYSRHFASTCIRVCGYESTAGGIDHNGQVTAIGYCPIGVDVERVMSDRDRPGVAPKIEALRKLYQGKKIIVGREKLDVAKGVYNKLQAFDKFLQVYPEWRGQVVLIQVTTPALSESPNLERKVAELVSHINGTYGTLDFTPVHHYHQAIERDEYFALLSVADLALITSLRDGMNTTSMEFVLCQDKTQKSPLVLSEFMGTASSFSSALLINPHDLLGVANAINQGLGMPEAEKLTRHAELLESVKSHTSHTWARTLLKQLLENIGGEHQAHQTPALDKKKLVEAYKGAKKRLLLFDYDGTLTPIVKVPSEAVPTDRTREVISTLAQDPNNVVFLISGRDGAFLDEHWGMVENLGMSAEHGSFYKPPGHHEWINMTEQLDMSWFSEVEEIFRYYTERTTGSSIETKKASVTWHYRNSDPSFGEFQCKQCLDLLESNVAPRRPIEVLVGKKNLEVRPSSISKSEIVRRLVYEHPDAEFIFCAGDDKTDEDMFRALRQIFPPGGPRPDGSPNLMAAPIAVTTGMEQEEIDALPDVPLAIQPAGVWAVAVGPSTKKTLASWHVTSPDEVVDSVAALI